MDDSAGWEGLRARVPKDYRPIGKLGSGGGASVLHACSTRSSSDVAIKIAHGDDDPEAHRFKVDAIWTEAQALRRLSGVQGVISLIACEGTPDDPVLILERIQGRSLKQVLRHGAITLKQALQLLARLADVVAFVHARGVIHRDVKPDNVLVVEGPRGLRPVLIDFGLAVFVDAPTPWSGSQRISGSPHYMAPEAFIPEVPGGFGQDLYALGVMLFEICTGLQPFRGVSIPELYYRHSSTPVPALDNLRPQARYPGRLEHLVQVALEKSSRLRLSDAAAFARELRETIEELGPVGDMPLPIPVQKRIELGPTQLARPQPLWR